MHGLNSPLRRRCFMEHEEMEKLVINKLLEGEDEIFEDLRKQYKEATVKSREFTGVGFFTTFNLKHCVPKYSRSGRIDDVSIEYPDSKGDACFILYIEDGKIDSLEGYTIGEDWNCNYDNIRIVYCLPGKRRYELE